MPALCIGITADLLDEAAALPPDAPADALAEYEPPQTLAALQAAVRACGHTPRYLGGPRQLLRAAAEGGAALRELDAVWNIAEGYGPRNREAWAPVLLEMAGLPALGSDALSQSLSLDKAWTLDVAAAAGAQTAGHQSYAPAEDADTVRCYDALARRFGLPLFVKPRWEGTAKGISAAAKVASAAEFSAAVQRITRAYRQPALVEPFLPGPEYTVTLIGGGAAPPRSLGVLQRALNAQNQIGLHAAPGPQWETPGILSAALIQRLEAQARLVFGALRCLDFARADFKCNAKGAPRLLEINPLPTFAPDGSFAMLAEMADRNYGEWLGETVLQPALARLGLHA